MKMRINFLTKRQKIVTSAIIMTLALVLTLAHNNLFYRVQFVIGLALLTYFLSLWSLWEGMTKLKALVLLSLPTFFTVAMASFAYLLPLRWLVRLPFALCYGLSAYAILLSQNVFNVAAIRTIPLYRASTTVSFSATIITAFLLFSVISSLNLAFFWNGISIFLISLPLIIPIIWSVEMKTLDGQTVIISLVISLITAEIAIALSFWPVATTMWSLVLSTAMYLLLGIMTERLRDRLTKRVVGEYLAIGIIVLIFTTISTSWTG